MKGCPTPHANKPTTANNEQQQKQRDNKRQGKGVYLRSSDTPILLAMGVDLSFETSVKWQTC